MVTKHQIGRLYSRMDELAAQWDLAEKPSYQVWLRYFGESDQQFYTRCPDAPLRMDVILNPGGDPAYESAGVPRNE